MASDKFFSDEYLDKLNPQKQVEQGPVTVFGLKFKNDEERRQYFREELRRHLPELRKIEGFPIGEDDDIINLSTLHIIRLVLILGLMILFSSGKKRRKTFSVKGNERQTLR